MTTAYYVDKDTLTSIPAGSIISFSIEQAIIQYKLRDQHHLKIEAMINAEIFSFDINISNPPNISEEELKYADIDYHLGSTFKLTTNVKKTPVQKYFFAADEKRIRDLVVTRSMDDLSDWFQKYRPVKVIDQYITMTNTLADHLASVMEHGLTTDLVEPIRSNTRQIMDLQERLINEYFSQENEIDRLRQLIEKLMTFDNIDDARHYFQVEKNKHMDVTSSGKLG